MPTHTVCGDDDQFVNSQNEVNEELAKTIEVMKLINTPSGITVCIDCAEPIDPRRKLAVPGAVRCIDCEEYINK